MTAEIVPGLAEAIDRRRRTRYPTVKTFAHAAEVTPTTLYRLLRGERREYRTHLRHGVARALEWPPDAIDRLLRGEDPATFPTVIYEPSGHRTIEPADPPRPSTYEVELAALRAQVAALEARLDALGW